MSQLTHSELEAALGQVMDPCSLSMGAPTDIWEMGLVEGLEVDGGEVRVQLVLTDPSCVFFRGIRSHVVDALLAVPGVEAVEVELVAGVVWTPERMRRPAGGAG
jgi:metal-sulfur cluster biosynthetic enzyme